MKEEIQELKKRVLADFEQLRKRLQNRRNVFYINSGGCVTRSRMRPRL